MQVSLSLLLGPSLVVTVQKLAGPSSRLQIPAVVDPSCLKAKTLEAVVRLDIGKSGKC